MLGRLCGPGFKKNILDGHSSSPQLRVRCAVSSLAASTKSFVGKLPFTELYVQIHHVPISAAWPPQSNRSSGGFLFNKLYNLIFTKLMRNEWLINPDMCPQEFSSSPIEYFKKSSPPAQSVPTDRSTVACWVSRIHNADGTWK